MHEQQVGLQPLQAHARIVSIADHALEGNDGRATAGGAARGNDVQFVAQGAVQFRGPERGLDAAARGRQPLRLVVARAAGEREQGDSGQGDKAGQSCLNDPPPRPRPQATQVDGQVFEAW